MPTAAELSNTRVLVVDDNAVAREVLESMVRSFGVDVRTAEDGYAALRAMDQAAQAGTPFNLLLTDWQMPGMDGVALVDRARTLHQTHLAAAVMVTAHNRDELQKQIQQAGITVRAVLTKPVTPSTLLEAIGPALHSTSAPVTLGHSEADQPINLPAHLRGTRVLLVEDNDLNQELAIALLAEAGMNAVVANNGQEALDRLKVDDQFDAILMDCQMPVLDGYETTRLIRQQPKYARLPILAMTANAMSGDKEKVLAAGMNDHIAKPLDVQQMFMTLGQWIKPVTTITEVSPDNPIKNGEKQARSALPADTLPNHLPGIDIRKGLATSMNNPVLYRRLLQRFALSQSSFSKAFEQAQAQTVSDPKAAERCAHTLRGAAGNIGALQVQQTAAALEHLCSLAGTPNAPETLKTDLATTLQATLKDLDTVLEGLAVLDDALPKLPTPAPKAALTAAEESRLPELLDTLRSLLTDGDPDAESFWNEHRQVFTTCLPDSAAIEALIKGFDHDGALERISDFPNKNE